MKAKIFAGITIAILAGLMASEKENLGSNVKKILIDDSIINIAQLFNTFVIFILLAMIIEVACEVFVSVLTIMKLLPADPTDTPGMTDDDKTEATRERKGFALLLCIVFGLLVATNGFLFMQLSLQALTKTGTEIDAIMWRQLDVVVTALVLAGGADGIHQIWKSLKTTIDDNDSQAQAQTPPNTPAKDKGTL